MNTNNISWTKYERRQIMQVNDGSNCFGMNNYFATTIFPVVITKREK